MQEEKSLLDTIENIPNLIRLKIDDSSNVIKKLLSLKTKVINVIASGTSYNAAQALQVIAWKNYNIRINLFYSNFFANNFSANNLNLEEIYLFISQGGRTSSILKSIEKVKNMGGKSISLTEGLKNPIADLCELKLDIGSQNEKFVFRTAGYTLSVLSIYQLVLALAFFNKIINSDDLKRKLKDLQILPFLIEEAIKACKNWYLHNQTYLKKAKAIFVAGGSELYPVANEAAIKLMEMVPLVTNSFELEELIHGPQNAFNQEMAFILMTNNSEDFRKACLINQFLRQEMRAGSLFLHNESQNEEDKEIGGIYLNTEGLELENLVFISFIQVLSYYLAVANNRNLSERLNASVDSYIKKNI